MSSLRPRLEREFFPFVEKPLRYTGNELNIVRKPAADVTLQGVFCFPDLYEIGMSHYGSQIIYHIVNSTSRWALARCYHPWADAESILRSTGIPLYSLEYFAPLREADWLGFTVQYELQYTNILNMLDLAGLPVRRAERGENDPIVIAGGPCMGNPEPLAPFMDACLIGDGEKSVVDICGTLEQGKTSGWGRDRTLRALADIEGVYVPALFDARETGSFVVPVSTSAKTVRAARVSALDDAFYPDKPLVPVGEVVHHRLAVEVMRGCTRGCRFCSAGTYYRPVREREVESIRRQIEHSVRTTGWREAGLLSLSTADYSGIDCLLGTLQELRRKERLGLSLPSTRIDALSPEQIKALNIVSPASSFTVAPEAGSQRLRNVVNKDFSDRTIKETVATLADNNIQTLKLYFMIGLPTETDEDIAAMIVLIGEIADILRQRSRRRTVSVAISPFSPKPFTPFQWERVEDAAVLLERSQRIKNELRGMRNVKVSYRDPHMAHLETVMARGDRRVGELVWHAWKLGARFDGWDEHFSWERWCSAAVEAGIDMDRYCAAIASDQPLPWSAVTTGVGMSFLLEERERALRGEVTEDCRHGQCAQCGVCGRVNVRLAGHRDAGGDSSAGIEYGRSAVRNEESTPTYYLVAYAKGEEARFVSHRDTMNLFLRAFSAAGLPLAYSQGYHPHPKVSFGPPLATGIMGKRELFHCAMTKPVQLSVDTLAPWLPNAVKILEIRALPTKPPSLETTMAAARYSLVPCRTLDRDLAEKAVADATACTSLVVSGTRKGRSIERDIRPMIMELAVRGEAENVWIEAVLSARPGATCRPDELIPALFPGTPIAHFLVTRTECLARAAGGLLAPMG